MSDFEAKPNTNISGFSFYFPFIEKLRLYQTYLTKSSLWEIDKKTLWSDEKKILSCVAKGETHKNLLSGIGAKWIREKVGGFQEKYKNESKDKGKDDKGLEKITHLMGNLVLKGFAEPIYNYEVSEDIAKAIDLYMKIYELNDKETNDKLDKFNKEFKEKAIKHLYAEDMMKKNFQLDSITINSKGLLMGQLINEVKSGQRFIYRLTIVTITFIIAISVLLGLPKLIGLQVSEITDFLKSFPIPIRLFFYEQAILFVVYRWMKT